MLGQDLCPRLVRAGFEVIGMDVAAPEPFRLDITQPEEVRRFFETFIPDLAINCAAYTAVDKAESEVEQAFAVNHQGAAQLAEACRRLGSFLVHLSTDYVFDGEAKQPYGEEAPAHPINVYGLSKWQGEEAIRARLPRHLIVRTAWLFGVHGHNFVKTILRLAREREELRVVNDQFGCPTWTGDLADALVTLTRHIQAERTAINWDTYHFCGGGQTTWHGFAQAIVEEGRRWEPLRAACVLPISTYPTPARRPHSSVLDCRKIKAFFNITPQPWRQGLVAMLTKLYGERKH